ncbi:MAG TPA: hypothetical protein VFL83_01745 [Anaeromyxobacter sp.]|nr:hypothetical protein [Anaeromyxobacter sp.]
MPLRTIAAVIAAAALALAGCAGKGVLLVRGVVRAEDRLGAEPLRGATVQCRDGRDGARGYARATTRDDGAYRIEHPYDGRWVPLVQAKGGDPWLEFSAPGYLPRLVRVRGGAERGVVRRPSGPWLQLDVTLVPEPAAAAAGSP